MVASDVEPYTIVVGNPAKDLRKRSDDELIDLLLAFKWWDRGVEEINALIPLLTCSDLEKVKRGLATRLRQGRKGEWSNILPRCRPSQSHLGSKHYASAGRDTT